MNRKISRLSRLLPLVLLGAAASPAMGHDRTVHVQPGRGVFEANDGQAGAGVRFLSRGPGHTVLLTREGATVLLSPREEGARPSALTMTFAGSSGAEAMRGIEPATPVYDAGQSGQGPLSARSTFQRVHAASVYSGIGVEYYTRDRELEFDFQVAAHADPRRIRMTFSGASTIGLSPDGELVLEAGGHTVRLRRPVLYQEKDGRRQEVRGGYVMGGRRRSEVGFEIGHYDASRPLVIDPVFVIGSDDDDELGGFDANAQGEAYILGNAPTGAGYPLTLDQPGTVGNVCFLTKVDATGTTALYSILFSDTELCGPLTVSASGTAYFTGYANPIFPGLHVATLVAVDDSSGTPVVRRFEVPNYSQFFNAVSAMAVDAQENVYLLGPCRTVEPNLPPLTLNGFNTLPNAGRAAPDEVCVPGGVHQTVLTKVDPTGSIVYGTFLSPDDADNPGPGPYGLAVDDQGHAYVTGPVTATLSPTTSAFRPSCDSLVANGCGYVMVVDTNLTGAASLRYASYLWDTEGGAHQILRLGPGGSLYLIADGASSTFPETAPTSPYSPLLQSGGNLFSDLKIGFKLARFDLDATGMPAFDYGLILGKSGLPESLAGLRILPSDAPVVATVLFDSQAVQRYHGELYVLYPSGQMLASYQFFPIFENGFNSPPELHIATAGTDVLYATNSLQATPSGSAIWDIATDRYLGQDPGANTPPVIRATSIDVVSQDPEGTMVSPSILAFDFEDGPLVPSCAPDPFSYVFPLGTTHVLCSATDSGGAFAGTGFDVTVRWNSVPVPAGDPPPVQPPSLFGTPATLTFHGVQPPGGEVALAITGYPRALPAGVYPPIPRWVFDLQTTAVFDTVEVCIEVALADPNVPALKLYELVGGTWTDVGATVTVTFAGPPTTIRACATVTQLGPFALGQPGDPAEVIETVAGNTLTTYNGDGIAATSASLYAPRASAADAWGDVYIADTVHSRVRKVSGGIITTVASVPGPEAVALDPTGALLVADAECHISRLDAHGALTQVAGTVCGPSSPDGTLAAAAVLANIRSLAVDSGGNVFFSDSEYRVRRIAAGADGILDGIDPAETLTTVAGTTFGFGGDGGKATEAQISTASQIAFDRFNNLFLADTFNYRVRRVAAGHDGFITGPPSPDDGSADDETISTVAGQGPYGSPNSCTSDGNGGPATAGWMCTPQSVAIDANGDLLIGENFLRRVTANASGLVVGGPDEIISSVAATSRPGFAPNGDGSAFTVNVLFTDLDVDPLGNVIITDGINNQVRRYRPPHAAPARPVLSIGDTATEEGNAGDTLATLTVTATGAMPYPVEVDYNTSDDSAAAGADYTPTSGRVTLTSAQRTAVVTVALTGDMVVESDEQLFVTLSGPTGGAVLGHPQAALTIVDDDENHPPVATNFLRTVKHDTVTPLSPTTAATDPDGDPLTLHILTAPAHGTLALQPDQSVLYTPELHYVGPDSFDFSVNDGHVESNVATAEIDVFNHAPSALVLSGLDFKHDTSQPLFLSGLAWDPDGDVLSLRIVIPPAHGTLATTPGSLDVVYTPDLHYVGLDTFDYAVDDGIVESAAARVFLNVRNAAPTIGYPVNAQLKHDTTVVLFPGPTILSNDGDAITWRVVAPPAHGSLTLLPDDSVLYTPDPHFAGPDEFKYVGNDGVVDSLVATALLTVTNLAPQSPPFSAVTPQNTPVTLFLSAHDGDGDPLTFSIVTGPSHGTLGPLVGSQITYTPDAPYFGPDQFTFKANDGVTDSAPGTATIRVDPPFSLGVVVTSPNDGERVFVGVPTLLRWNVSGAYPGVTGQFTVELSRNNGTTWAAIPGCVNVPVPTAGTCGWTPSGPATTQGLIRVTVSDSAGHTATDVSDAAFSIAGGAPSVTVTSPNSALIWAEGTTHAITWNHNLGAHASFNIDVSRDNGGNWAPIASQFVTSANPATYSWVVPGPQTPAARVRVSWADGPATDTSNVSFAIVTPTITITSPNTAVGWRAGTTHVIRFNHGLGLNQPIQLDLSRDSGISWEPIASVTTTAAASSSFSWSVTGPPTTHARVRAKWLNPPGAVDVSDTDFTILPRVTVTSPNTAVVWGAGSIRTITWTHNVPAGEIVNIDASVDDKATWTRLGSVVASVNGGTFTGPLPATVTTHAWIRVSPATYPDDGDTNDVAFTLAAPTVTVIAPNVPLRVAIGQTLNVNWSHDLGRLESMAVELSRDGGATWSMLAPSVANATDTSGHFSWPVIGPVTTRARIRVSSNHDATVLDTSNVDFTIASPVTVTSPNSPVTWAAGSTHTISWNHTLGAGQAMDIDFSADGGLTWSSLASAVPSGPSSGSYAAVLPAIPTTQALVRVSPAGRPGDGDTCNSNFTLAAPSLTVTSPNTNVAWATGSMHNITWTQNLGTQEAVRIELSRDGGSTWTTLAASVANSGNASGAWSWAVSGPATTAARIRVTWTRDPSVQDMSNVNFRIP